MASVMACPLRFPSKHHPPTLRTTEPSRGKKRHLDKSLTPQERKKETLVFQFANLHWNVPVPVCLDVKDFVCIKVLAKVSSVISMSAFN